MDNWHDRYIQVEAKLERCAAAVDGIYLAIIAFTFAFALVWVALLP